MAERRNLAGMVAVITGASAGIGEALARELGRRGARLVLAARRVGRIEELNQSLGGGHLAVRTDVADPRDCEALIARAVESFGRIDTLVCNAGYGLFRPVAETSAEEARRIFQTNVFGTTDCIRAAVPHMLKQAPGAGGWRGQVVVVSSAVARRALPYFGAYAATKAAQLSLAEALRVELKPRGVAVTSIHPVGTETEFWGAAGEASGTGVETRRTTGEVRQSAEQVAEKTARAIERPVPEVWPFAPSRFYVSLATLIPGLVDRVMAKRLPRGDARRVEEAERLAADERG